MGFSGISAEDWQIIGLTLKIAFVAVIASLPFALAVAFLLSRIPYEDLPAGDAIQLPPRQEDDPTYVRPDPATQKVIPQVYAAKAVE